MHLYINWNIDPIIVSLPAGIKIGYYGLCWVMAFVASYVVMKRIFVKEGLDKDTLNSLLIYVALGTFIGARLGHCLFYDPDYYFARPWEIILPITKNANGKIIFEGYRGLASHGAAVGIIVSLLIFSYRKKMNLWDITDKLGVVTPLGGFFIRLGNLFNSEIIGKASSSPWAFVFERVDNVPRHPSQLYEAIAYLFIFLTVYYFYSRKKSILGQGFIFGLSITLIFTARFLIEYTKEVQESFETVMRSTVGMDMGQMLSLPFVVAGIIIMIKSKKQPDNVKR